MSGLAYTVSCRFTDESVAEEWLQWLREEHLADVLACGAMHAHVVRHDTEGPEEAVHMEVRYIFPSRDAFATYEREHASRLREEGLRRFPLTLGLRYSRSTGDVVAERVHTDS